MAATHVLGGLGLEDKDSPAVGSQAGFGGTRARSRLGFASPTWGDGFADDEMSQVRAVGSWAQCSTDEYVRFFPRLLAPHGQRNPFILAHLRRCVAAHAWRQRFDQALALVSLSDADRSVLGRDSHDEWFRPASPLTVLAALVHGGSDEAASRRECQAVLQDLDRILASLSAGTVPLLRSMSTAGFAFHTALHPAYLWPSALCTAERDSVAGWLGILQRGRPAFMPLDVADYLLDVIVNDGPDMSVRDPAIALLIDKRDLLHLRRRALQRRAGRQRVVQALNRRRSTDLDIASLARTVLRSVLGGR